MVPLGTLTRPTGRNDRTAYLHPDEADFYDAYIAHVLAADALAAAADPLYWDAMYHLNFGVECFLKYAFCLVRRVHLGIATPADATACLQPWTAQSPFRAKAFLHPSNFSHDFKKLRLFFDSETDAPNFSEYRNLATSFPADTKWVEERYKPRVHSQFGTKYLNYRSDLTAALQVPFGGIA